MNIFEIVLTQPLANGIILFYRVLGGNLGLAILAFSLALRVALNPLTKPYMENMKKMRDYQKDIDKLKKRHKDDKAKLAKAQADFYKEKGINPTAGCLPYILQIVVLIAFFNMFTRVLSPDIDIVSRFNELLYEPLKFASGEVVNTRFLHLDLIHPDKLVLDGGLALPGITLILAALAQLVSAKMNQPFLEMEESGVKKTKDKSDDIQVAMQGYVVYMFPAMTLFIGLNFPSGLALYWLMFSLFQVWQQYKTSGWGGATPWVRKVKSDWLFFVSK